MKILVIDDKQKNLEDAKIQLADHEVTTLSSINEIRDCYDDDETGGFKGLKNYFKQFDVILTDLFMPAIQYGARPGIYEEVPYGVIVTMLALRFEIPVAIVTDIDHHRNPFAYASDLLRSCIMGSTPFGFYSHGSEKRWDIALKYLLEVKVK